MVVEQSISEVTKFGSPEDAFRVEDRQISAAARREARTYGRMTKEQLDQLTAQLARDAKNKVGMLSMMIDETLHAGGSVDLIGSLRDYEAITGFGFADNTPNNKVLLRNAVMDPDGFVGLDSYGTQRASLALKMHQLGLDSVILGSDVVVTMQTPYEEGHKSEPRTAVQNETFTARLPEFDQTVAELVA